MIGCFCRIHGYQRGNFICHKCEESERERRELQALIDEQLADETRRLKPSTTATN